MKKRNFLLSGFNAFTLAERICGSAGAKLQAGKGGLAAARSAEYGLNPSPPAPLPQGERGNEEMFLPQGERGNKAFTLAERICRGRLNPSPLCGRGEKADGCKAGKREPQSRQRQRSDNRRERKAFSRGVRSEG